MPEVLGEALQANGLSLSDVDLFVFHQANLRINEMVEDRVRAVAEQILVAVSPSPYSPHLIRAARRMAGALHARRRLPVQRRVAAGDLGEAAPERRHVEVAGRSIGVFNVGGLRSDAAGIGTISGTATNVLNITFFLNFLK